MAVRQSYQFSAPSGSNGGLVMGDPVDTKFFNVGNTVLRWGIDSDFTNRLRLGGSVAGPGGQSLPVVPYGGFGVPGRTVSGVVTVTVDDVVLRCNSAGGNVTLNLPAAANMADQYLDLYKIDLANLVNVVANGAELISGLGTFTFGEYQVPIRIRSNGVGWDVLTPYARPGLLIDNTAPGYSTASAVISTIQSVANVYFSGRPCMFFLSASGRKSTGAGGLMVASFFIQIDAGADNLVCDWNTNLFDNHQTTSGAVLITPTQGLHTVNLRANRTTGADTFALDTSDFIRLVKLDL